MDDCGTPLTALVLLSRNLNTPMPTPAHQRACQAVGLGLSCRAHLQPPSRLPFLLNLIIYSVPSKALFSSFAQQQQATRTKTNGRTRRTCVMPILWKKVLMTPIRSPRQRLRSAIIPSTCRDAREFFVHMSMCSHAAFWTASLKPHTITTRAGTHRDYLPGTLHGRENQAAKEQHTRGSD